MQQQHSLEELLTHEHAHPQEDGTLPAAAATPKLSGLPELQGLSAATLLATGSNKFPGAYLRGESSLPRTPPTSPVSSRGPLRSRAGPGAVRRAALMIRTTRSAAALNQQQPPRDPVPWPPRGPPPPSRSQSLILQPQGPCCCCGAGQEHPPYSRNASLGGAPDEAGSPGGSSNEGHGRTSYPDGTLTPEGLSWRRLHISRAKLKATATTSELLSGFAMVAMVELQINDGTKVPEWLFVLFSVCTTVLVAVHIFALMISTYILPNIDAVSRLHTTELVVESPHERMRWFIELAWAFSTVLGLFLFLVEVAILCWVKFWDYSFAAAVASTVIVVPSLAIFVGFAAHFYHTLVVHKCEASDMDMRQLEQMQRSLEEQAAAAGGVVGEEQAKTQEKPWPLGYSHV